jgi:hypothetical protein
MFPPGGEILCSPLHSSRVCSPLGVYEGSAFPLGDKVYPWGQWKSQELLSGWPDCANFCHLHDCLHLASFWKFAKVGQIIGLLYSTLKFMHFVADALPFCLTSIYCPVHCENSVDKISCYSTRVTAELFPDCWEAEICIHVDQYLNSLCPCQYAQDRLSYICTSFKGNRSNIEQLAKQSGSPSGRCAYRS